MEKPIYFKGLNGIRAIASLIVVVWHTDQYLGLFNLDSLNFHKNGMAGRSVDIFFVLSGFLITYLLFVEKEKTKTINLKKFYIRRILRIWPIYYLSILITIILIQFDISPSPKSIYYSIGLYTFLMANLAYAAHLAISSITPLWSVGVEEQFYLIWPNIIKYSTNHFKSIFIFFIGYLLLKLFLYFFLSANSIAYNFVHLTRIDIMCIGAFGAYFVYTKNIILNYLYKKSVQIIAWSVLLISCVFKPIHIFSFIDSEINAVFYLIIILNVSTNPKSIISLENKILNFLGKISYGMYVYHMILIFILSFLVKSLNINLNYLSTFIIILTSTILLSTLSYFYFEKFFLSLKHKFTVVESSNQSPQNN